MIIVAALYKFKSLTDTQALCIKLKNLTQSNNILGTLLIAEEGINGTVAGSREAIDALKLFFINENLFDDMEYKESSSDNNPFYRMKVKIKKEIVTLGKPEAKPSEIAGTYISAKDWNNLIQDPEVTVIDVRNDYEIEVGTFKNSINPKTSSFKEFPDFVSTHLDPKKHKKIAMSCTGGIRCEKASSFMKQQGFSEVYHLKGGILKYLEEIEPEKSLYHGECFVFDQRVSVSHGLNKGTHDLCHGCGMPLKAHEKESKYYQKGICCPKCIDERSDKQKASAKSRQQQMTLAKLHGSKHLGAKML
jgi:UPF0176 protein